MKESEFVCRVCSDEEVCVIKVINQFRINANKTMVPIETPTPISCPWGNELSKWVPLEEEE